MDIDITITATIRPDVYKKCLNSLIDNLINNNPKYNFRLIINIDPVGEIKKYNKKYIKNLTLNYYKNCNFIMPQKPSFPIAVKSLWKKINTDISFHTEDDTIFLEKIDMDNIISLFEENVGFIKLQSKLDTIIKRGLSVNKYKNEYYIINREKNKPVGLFTLNPTFFRSSILKRLENFVKENESPERLLMLRNTDLLDKSEILWTVMII